MACPTCVLLKALLESMGVPTSDAEKIGSAVGKPVQRKVVKKVKRKASKYNLEYKKQYAKLKKKHPRTGFASLAKKAHRATKRAMRR